MSDEIKDAREVSPELSMTKRSEPGFGPGFVNLAVPDRGHIPSCIARDFDDAEDYNNFCAEHPDWLTVYLWPRGDKILAVFQVLKTDLQADEMRMVSQFAEEKMAEFRARRAEEKATEERLRREKEEADDECRRIGRLCIEKHGAFVKELPGLSTLKNVRKNIADDILKEIAALKVFADEDWTKLTKILAKYVKEGVK